MNLYANLPTIQYGDNPTPEQFHRAVADARRAGPVALGPFCPEVLGYDLVRAVLRDPRFVTPQGIALLMQGITSGPVWDRVTRLLLHLDGAEHRRLRALVAKAFSPRAAERMRGACIDVITELVDQCAAIGRCEFVAEIARWYPIAIIGSLLGAPRNDWEQLSEWVTGLSKAMSIEVAQYEAEILRAWNGLEGYIEQLIAVRRSKPADDLISELLRAEEDGDRLSHDELIALVVILFNAGIDTTRHQLAAAMQVLVDHPDQWKTLSRCPELVPQAVEEVLRYAPVNFRVLRKAVVDVDLGGVTFPSGSFVVANTAAANRDPAAFEDPDHFDIARTGTPAMLTFGGGVHYCLGVHLARIELVEALRVLTARMSNPRQIGPAPWKPVTELTGPQVLPLEFVGRDSLSPTQPTTR
ncbi:cytochrome P450 [Mycolicibacter heraklionensis]|uniref:Cytochrome P450 n=1 Tax=Mycolicibacter heraklionensis TaxID=512402 RepID=A0ABR5FG36_9MYCO|nr:cytochrome P450 [Mycolicibacter heraklionensis]KLO29277.1 cytochrome P450 [Mycolicibacter heraklionensis]